MGMLVSSVVFAEDLYYCFRLEGLRMSCAGGIEGPPVTSPPITTPLPCTETCANTPAQCSAWTICRGRTEEATCPGTGIQPDCSVNSYCTVVTASQTEPVTSTNSCTYTTGTQHMCGSPIKGNGEGCVCNGSCDSTGSSCTYNGSSDGCTSSCGCGPGSDEIITASKSWCVDGGSRSCNVYQRNVPAVGNGACGCVCPDPGGSLSTPECGTAGNCTPEARPPECGP